MAPRPLIPMKDRLRDSRGKVLPYADIGLEPKYRQLPDSRKTTLRDVFPELRKIPGSDTNIRRMAHLREEYPGLYAKVLMACTSKQVLFLEHLWNVSFGRSPYMTSVAKFIVNQGRFPDFVDYNSESAARELARLIAEVRSAFPPTQGRKKKN
jgi:hypothetical protein